jgi:hypothetical protein
MTSLKNYVISNEQRREVKKGEERSFAPGR